MSDPLSAHGVLDLLLDPGTFRSWDRPPQPVTDPSYRDVLAAAAEKAGTDESVLTGEGRIAGHRVAVLVSEFSFLAGSIGSAAARRLTAAVERATAAGLPLIAAPCSGGTRMQEGTEAFLMMVPVTAAIAAHRSAGLLYVVYLRHPTVGGTCASWASLGHLTLAQPGALVGFLGPRVYEALHGESFPTGVQTAANLYEHGLLDGVVDPAQLRDVVARVLDLLLAHPVPTAYEPLAEDVLTTDEYPTDTAWDVVTAARDPRRPGLEDLLGETATGVVRLHGTGAGEAGSAVVLALVRLGGAPCVLIGQDRQAQQGKARLGPADLRTARRGIALARELRLPLLAVVDTPGGELSVAAEEGALAGEIARCLADLISLPTPTVSLLLGSGTGGAALAMLPADRVVAAQNGWLAPLPPEGASAIVHHDTDHAPQLAAAHGVRAVDLARSGHVDVVVREEPDAAREPGAFCRRVARVVDHALAQVVAESPGLRRSRRAARLRATGDTMTVHPGSASPGLTPGAR